MTTLLSDRDLTEQPSHMYYDIVIANTHSINEQEPYLRFNEKRTVPLLQHPENYKLSIVRFMCDTHTLPLMQPTIMNRLDQEKYFPNDTNMNRTVYSITIEKNGVDRIQQYLTFTPQDMTLTQPTTFNADGSVDYLTGYYNIYSYEHFISMCNTAIKDILSSELAGLMFNYPVNEPIPSFIYDANSKKISLQASTNLWNSNDASDYKIYVNTALYRLLNSMPAQYVNVHDPGWGRNYLLDTYNHANNIVTVINYDTLNGSVNNTLGKDFYFISQEYSTVENWSPVSSIAFTSSNLNVEGTAVSALHEYIDGHEVVEGQPNRAVSMITDIASPSNYLPGIYYASQNNRWIDLKNSGPIKDINIEVFWVSKRAELHPMRLSAGGSCTMKLLFQKKNLIV